MSARRLIPALCFSFAAAVPGTALAQGLADVVANAVVKMGAEAIEKGVQLYNGNPVNETPSMESSGKSDGKAAPDIEFLVQCRGWDGFDKAERRVKSLQGVRAKTSSGTRIYTMPTGAMTLFGLHPIEIWFSGDSSSGFLATTAVFKEPPSKIAAKNRGQDDGFSEFYKGAEQGVKNRTLVSCSAGDGM